MSIQMFPHLNFPTLIILWVFRTHQISQICLSLLYWNMRDDHIVCFWLYVSSLILYLSCNLFQGIAKGATWLHPSFQGFDMGGPQKEFFQLVCHEIFDSDYGMFTHCDESRSLWINGEVCFEKQKKCSKFCINKENFAFRIQ